MDAQLIRDTEGQTIAVTEYIGSLAAALSDTAKMIGEAAMLKRLQSVGDAQFGYRSQLIAYAGRSDTRDVVGYLREEFAKTLMTTHDADVEIVPDA
jgi:gamma-glutamyl:cysteine ligase YbdK (ATP-grasp superfamily)